ncbi:hypothetical protein [Sphingomonas sp. EC-HK361]|jgi:hypothetical protein|uniref:hypothetical protein n=1 Tax=Sphingomonas sp. EC-HK361 TaxID=2038397 RepID=UPI00125F0BE5|nr:hypothetical protein [Sphingomonas sp. EC-HK361]
MSCLALIAACSRPAPETNVTDVAGSAGAVDRNVAEVAPSPEPSPVPVPSPSPSATPANLAGRWIGVEGMYLVVKPTAPDTYALEMQYDLDHKMTATGRAADDGIAFERDGKTLTLKPSDGAATGLKYLDGKRDCLTVAPGEGYCRG